MSDEMEPSAAGEANSIPSLGVWDFARMILVLAAVVGAIYLIFYLLKRTAAGRYSSNNLIKHVGSLSLPGNKFVHLVEVGQQMFLVGTSDHNINLISEISDKETLDELRLEVTKESDTQRRSFSELFAGMFGGGVGGGPAASTRSARSDSSGNGGAGGSASGGGRQGQSGEAGNPFSFIQGQRERLRNLK